MTAPEKRHLYTTGGSVNGMITLEDNLVVFAKIVNENNVL
jgi:hypothetical protein